MYGNNFHQVMEANAWPGYFKEVSVKMNEGKYFAGKIECASGIICMYPNIKRRYIEHWLHGEVELDLFFRVYMDEKIEKIIKTPKKKPLLFFGSVERRFAVAKNTYPELGFSLEMFTFEDDKTRGKLSPSRAILLSSSDKELFK